MMLYDQKWLNMNIYNHQACASHVMKEMSHGHCQDFTWVSHGNHMDKIRYVMGMDISLTVFIWLIIDYCV